MQAYDSIKHEHFCIGFIGFMFKGKRLTDFKNLFSPLNFKKNGKVVFIYFFEVQYNK